MLSEEYRHRPLPAELETITISQQLAEQLHNSYAWLDVKGERPFASLISPAGTDEVALYHFIDNATLNHQFEPVCWGPTVTRPVLGIIVKLNQWLSNI